MKAVKLFLRSGVDQTVGDNVFTLAYKCMFLLHFPSGISGQVDINTIKHNRYKVQRTTNNPILTIAVLKQLKR